MAGPDRVLRADDELGAWTMWSRPADPRLSAWGTPIRGYHQLAPTPGRHVTTASALLPLVIPFDHAHRITSHDGAVVEVGAFLAGSHDAIGTVESDGFVGLQLDLAPPAAERILGGGLQELAGTAASLDDVFGPAARHLVERLGNTPDWDVRLDLLEGFLLDRWERGAPGDDTTSVIWEHLAAGTTRVDTLAEGAGCSPRQLRRRVQDHLGLPPKRLARVVRFQRTLQRLERDRVTPLAQVAAEHGFSDQPHMTREFASLADATPAEVRVARAPRDEPTGEPDDHHG